MSPKKRIAIGTVCGVMATVFMLVYVSGVRAEAMSSREEAIEKYGGDTVEVCVARHDIASGQTIDEQDVDSKTWLVDLLPEDAVTNKSDVVGQTVQSQILANEPISASKIGDPITSLTVPDGLCAVSVPSQDVMAVGGAIKSGSLVNVYASNSTSVRLLGENILVLETSNSGLSDSESATTFGDAKRRASISWVTLAVTPESVAELISASKTENIYFVLPGSQTSGTSATQQAGGE